MNGEVILPGKGNGGRQFDQAEQYVGALRQYASYKSACILVVVFTAASLSESLLKMLLLRLRKKDPQPGRELSSTELMQKNRPLAC